MQPLLLLSDMHYPVTTFWLSVITDNRIKYSET